MTTLTQQELLEWTIEQIASILAQEQPGLTWECYLKIAQDWQNQAQIEHQEALDSLSYDPIPEYEPTWEELNPYNTGFWDEDLLA